ncbi:ATP-binding cassette transporter ABC.B1 [Besnoitia besnoiti]|uniref:ATP-binding cassette transporter ABC.B1 n=1 Tax=Besnoitia besnoiti TaxID=94643 RepID=A0A2A9MCG2_BESBE|nr:ATP-binding cassette transporter ABC.B1 [Besnoitia besnoiti]PFH33343.1 ATP-binding cassette transporter ABC.B1 [Besnoitia besnoiti]
MMPAFISLLGDLLKELNTTVEMNYHAMVLAIIGAVELICGWAAAAAFEYLSDRQVGKFKRHYFATLIRQEQGWFDRNDVGSLSTRLDSNTSTIRLAVGVKSTTSLQFFATFVGSFITAYTRHWKMALVVSAALPVIAGCGAFLAWSLRSSQQRAEKAYSEAGRVAEESLRNVRTVASLGGEERMISDYVSNLKRAEQAAIKGGAFTGSAVGALMACVFFMYALGYWYAGGLIADGIREVQAAMASNPPPPGEVPVQPAFQGGDAVTVLICIMVGAFSLGQIIPGLAEYVRATEAARDLLEVITRQSLIDPFDTTGTKDVKLSGDIVYEKVSFSYPTRPEKVIFKDLSLTIPGGKTVALVGGSGCGKSTIVQLLQRQYEPTSGAVKFGDTPLKEIHLETLRAGLGVVNQEPKLFSATIEENISLGSKKPVTHAQVEAAAKKANAAGFIADFANKYETHCGAMGSQVSGGQKQRIAIARALVREPSVLIFDEATSALDNASERIVQAALDSLIATTGATTIIIAHRLSTIQRADLIIVLGHKEGDEGSSVVQQGTHEELMKDEHGLYYSLVQSQLVGMHADDDEDDGPTTAAEGAPDAPGASYATTSPQSMSRRRVSDQSAFSSAFSLISERLLETGTQKERSLWSFGKNKTPADGEEEPAPRIRMTRIFGLALKHWPFFLLTLVAACASGVVFPVYSVIFSRFIALFFKSDPDEIESEANKWSLAFVGLACSVLIVEWLKFLGIEYMGSKVTSELRAKAFTQTMHQDIAFFDNSKNNVGALMSILSSDVLVVKTGSCGNPMALAASLAAIVAGCIIAFTSNWKLALVILCCLFVLGPASMMQQTFMHTHNHPTQKGKKQPHDEEEDCPEQVLIEAVGGIRVVSAFGLEQHFIDRYEKCLRQEPATQAKNALLLGFFWGFSQGVQFGINALGMWYGGNLIKDGATATDVMQAIFALMFAGMTMGQTVLFSTDNARARMAAARVFRLIDTPSAIDSRDSGGRRFDYHSGNGGEVAFTNVNFRYSTRPTVPVYRNLSFTVKAGETVALVGPSGCGKSTAIQLIERFYDLRNTVEITKLDDGEVAGEAGGKMKRKRRNGGSITFDGTELKETNVSSLREQMGLVGQEPVLFNMSIEDNIRISKPEASEEDVIEAARQAHADKFIRTFPNGYKTLVGPGGSQLSGGQKQRIAIARALVRKPRLLLLDEATSALDAEAERQVQQTLDELVEKGHSHGTIIVAHRLSTVKNATKIVVLSNEDGRGSRVVEVGSHEELMKIRNGAYRQLVNMRVDAARGGWMLLEHAVTLSAQAPESVRCDSDAARGPVTTPTVAVQPRVSCG